jgi:hypothetical protein
MKRRRAGRPAERRLLIPISIPLITIVEIPFVPIGTKSAIYHGKFQA